MLQRTLRTKVHPLQAPRISIRTFRSSTRLNTNEFTEVVATKINKIEADVSALKGDVSALKRDVSALKTDIRELGLRLERSIIEQLGGHALNRAKQTTQFYFNSICGGLGVTILLVGSSWILPTMEVNRLNAEIKRRPSGCV